jgi:hypothetical protein
MIKRKRLGSKYVILPTHTTLAAEVHLAEGHIFLYEQIYSSGVITKIIIIHSLFIYVLSSTANGLLQSQHEYI